MSLTSKPNTSRVNEGSPIEKKPASNLPTVPAQGISRDSEPMEPSEIFRAFFFDSLIPLYIFAADTLQVLEANEAAVMQYGYTREEFLELYVTELQPNEEVARLVTFVHEQLPQILSNGGMDKWHLCGTWRHRRKNGTIVDVSFAIHSIPFAGRPAIAVSAFDITEMLRADATLRYSTELVYQLTDNLDAVFWVATPTLSRFLYISAAYEKLWGRSRANLYANAWSSLDAIHPEDRARVEAATRNTFAEFDQEYRIIRPDGEVRWIHGRAFPVRSTNEETLRVAGIAEDITEQKLAQEALDNVSRQLIAAQEVERRHFAGELHDEIGQTLTALKINIETVLQETPLHLQSRLHESVQMIDATVEQVRNLCLDLRPSQLDDLGLTPTLNWYVDRQAQRTGLRIHLTTSALPRQSSMIETTCFRIVQEALTNVARHAQTQDVWVELQQRGANIELVIFDHGVGFHMDQVHRRSLQGRSSGILGMEKRVRLAGGKFAIFTQPHQGVRISVVLPCQASDQAMKNTGLPVTLNSDVKPRRRKANRKRTIPATEGAR